MILRGRGGGIWNFAGIPSVCPWDGGAEDLNRRRETTSSLRDNTQITRPTYNISAPGRVAPRAVSPPRFGNLDATGPSLANMLPCSAHPASEIPNLAAPVLNFYGERKGLGRPAMIVDHMDIYPEKSPKGAKLSAGCMELYFSNDNAHDVPIIYFPHRGWFAYDVFRKEQRGGKLELTQILQAKFVGYISNRLCLAKRKDIIKQTRWRTTHPWRKFLQELEIPLSNVNQLREIIHEARLYFTRREPMDTNPMLLQLANATVDLKPNTTRQRNPGDYLSEMSTISVPDYAIGGGCTDEPEEARRNRDWAYSFYGPYRPPPSFNGEEHCRDFPHLFRTQGDADFTFFLQLLDRLPHGSPLKRTIYFPPRGRNSEIPVGLILTNLLGHTLIHANIRYSLTVDFRGRLIERYA